MIRTLAARPDPGPRPRSARGRVSQDGGPGQAVVTVDLATGQERDRRDTEVLRPGGDQFGPSLVPALAFVHADGRAYAGDDNQAGDEDDWMAFSIG